MKILVTGANGYLGQGIVKQLLNYGHTVIATDLLDDKIDKRAQIQCCDLFSISSPYDYFDKPDVLLHLAWRNGFVHNASSHIDDLPYHYRFIKSFVDANIPRIAVLGTMHEIGFFEGSIDENTPTNPQSLYGIAKDSLRNMTFVLASNKDIKIQWIRGFYIVGNVYNGNSIFSKISIAEQQGEKEFPFTSGTNQWDFIDYDVFCDQVACIVSQDEVTGIINACSGHPEKLSSRVERFIKENDYSIKLAYGKYPDRPYDSKAVWGNDRKINKIMQKNATHKKDTF